MESSQVEDGHLENDNVEEKETSNKESKADAEMQKENDDRMQQMQSGLEVMADAAAITTSAHPSEALSMIDDSSRANDNPTSDLELNIDKSFLPDVVELGLSTLMESVYSFKTTKEFFNLNNKPTKGSLLKQYTNGMKNGLMEMPLWHFKLWFDDLRFCDAVIEPKDAKSKVWHFRVIALDPSSPEIKNIAPIEAKLPKYRDFVAAFYTGLFEKSKAITEKINRAVANDKTIMIVALRLSPGTDVDNSFSKYSKLIVVSAVSYQTFRSPANKAAMDVFVSLMGVADDKTVCPSQLQAWRRNDLGLFMFIQVIKRCASIPSVQNIAIYLQCQEASSFQFYTKVGFRRLNSHLDDGFDKLPLHMHWSLKSTRPDTPGLGSAFLFFDRENESSAPYLMHLRTGALRRCKTDDSTSQTFQGSAASKPSRLPDQLFWCRYPPPLLPIGGRLKYTLRDIHEARTGLPLIKLLLPNESALHSLLPAHALPVKGEMSFLNRHLHSKSGGTKWLATGELDLMLSILSFDGRYEDIAFILPITYSEEIRIACKAYYVHQKLNALMKKNANMPSAQLDALVSKTLGDTRAKIVACSLEKIKYVLRKVVIPNLGMLQKKVLVFPSCEGEQHWSVTFVFNASFIQQNVEEGSEVGMLQPCFFRYCSASPIGNRKTKSSHGIPWFLNLCYSYELHDNLVEKPSGGMKWYFPYGDHSAKWLLGTKNFPSLRLNNPGHLPRQKDGYNCGVGACAAIGIVLRNMLRKEDNVPIFDIGFKRANNDVFLKDEETNESYLMFPDIFFQETLPTEDDLGWDDYLTTLREEWFVFFDRIAKLQYVTAPKRINPDNAIDPMYTDCLSKLEWPDYGRREARAKYSKAQMRVELEQLDHERARKREGSIATSVQSSSALPVVSQTPDSGGKRHIIKEDKTETGPRDIMDNFAEISSGTFNVTIESSTRMNDKASMTAKTKAVLWTKKVFANPESIKPVPLSINTKKRSWDRELLERVNLHRVEFEKKKDANAEVEIDDPESPYYKKAKKRKFSTQTTKTIEAFQKKYDALNESEDKDLQIIDDENYKKELDTFIAECFKKWGWFSEEEYQKDLNNWVDKMKARNCSAEEKAVLRRLINAIKSERAYYTAQFTNEFRYTRSTMVKALRFEKESRSFYARLMYKVRDKNNPDRFEEKEEEMKVEEEWIRAEYEDVDIQHVINMNQSNMWVDVPRDVEVRIAKKKVVRVRYVPKGERFVMDYIAMAKVIRNKDIKDAKRRALLGFPKLPVPDNEQTDLMLSPKRRIERAKIMGTPMKVARKPLVNVFHTKEEEAKQKAKENEIWKKSIIRKGVPTAAKWSGKFSNGKETTLDEEFVIMAFGEAFAHELKKNEHGWVDVPVGDCKPSHLHEHPNLKVIGAPRVHFNQSDGKDLCVSKSLASALYATGFHDEAIKIDAFGEEILKGAVCGALEKVAMHARTVLPSWIVIRSIPKDFDWKQGLDERHLLVGVLEASDGSCCHAITIHGGFIYDGNEKIGLPLCQEALDYCTSTSVVKSKFVKFRRGYILRYEGTKKQKLARMTLEAITEPVC